MAIVVTATSGNLGRLTVKALLDRGVAPGDVVAGARSLTKIADLVNLGVTTATIDYDRPETVSTAVNAGDTLILISGNDLANRDQQHAHVIAAAREAGVARIIYTSGLKADDTALAIAAMHLPTEATLRASGVAFTIVRNGWYTENYAHEIASVAATGVLLSSVGQARVASAARQDFAEALAVVVTEEGHEGQTYELSGDLAWDYSDLAAALSEVVGREVVHQSVNGDEQAAILSAAGVPAEFVPMAVGIDAGLATGAMAWVSGDLSRLIGRPTTPLVPALRALAPAE